MSNPSDPGHPVEHEIDDSQNPTAASPAEVGATQAGHAQGDSADPGQSSQGDHWQRPEEGSGRQHEMLRQLQDMIDQVTREARPVMRELVAKSAELAAVAAERAGPLAVKAAEKTQVYGERFAARSKEKAADLRRQGEQQEGPAEEPETVAGVPDQGGVMHPWGETATQPAEGDFPSGEDRSAG